MGLTLDAVLNALASDALVFLKHCGETPPLRGPADLRVTQHRRRRLHISVPPATSARFSGTGSGLPGGVPRFPAPAAALLEPDGPPPSPVPLSRWVALRVHRMVMNFISSVP